ncbi:MAG: DUF4381 domain-containing protein [Paracoccaceae bacterium]
MSDETAETGEATNLIDLLDQLILPEDPAPIPLTPETAGWWVVGAALLVALLWFVRHWAQEWRANAYRRAAIRELEGVGEDPAAIAAIMRRTALAAWPRDEVAGLTGEDWVAFLRHSGDFPEPMARTLARAPYEPGIEPDEGLSLAAEAWIRHHRVGGVT